MQQSEALKERDGVLGDGAWGPWVATPSPEPPKKDSQYTVASRASRVRAPSKDPYVRKSPFPRHLRDPFHFRNSDQTQARSPQHTLA